eukprot:3070603-Amphidinium_carterae.1
MTTHLLLRPWTPLKLLLWSGFYFIALCFAGCPSQKLVATKWSAPSALKLTLDGRLERCFEWQRAWLAMGLASENCCRGLRIAFSLLCSCGLWAWKVWYDDALLDDCLPGAPIEPSQPGIR